MPKPLTDIAIRKAVTASKKPGSKRQLISDGGAAGLTLRVEAGGSVFWDLRYTVRGLTDAKGKPVRNFETQLGDKQFYAERGAPRDKRPALILSDARAWAAQRRALARTGVDPVAEDESARRREEEVRRLAEMEGRTVSDFFEGFDYTDMMGAAREERGYLARHIAGLRQSRQTEQLWRNRILPHIGKKEARNLSRAEVADALEKLRSLGLTSQVNRVQAAITHFLGWLLDNGHLEVNVAAGMRRRVKERPRQRILEDNELRAIWATAEQLSPIARDFLHMLVLTGQRRDDVRLMRWDEIKDDGLWQIPANRYKIGSDHEVILPTQARTILEERRGDGSEFVFPGRDAAKAFNGARSLKTQLNAVLKDLPGWTLHDIRRTVRTGLAALGIADEIAERVVGHVQGTMTETYNRHRYREEKGRALQAWADRVERLVSGHSDNVVELRAP